MVFLIDYFLFVTTILKIARFIMSALLFKSYFHLKHSRHFEIKFAVTFIANRSNKLKLLKLFLCKVTKHVFYQNQYFKLMCVGRFSIIVQVTKIK